MACREPKTETVVEWNKKGRLTTAQHGVAQHRTTAKNRGKCYKHAAALMLDTQKTNGGSSCFVAEIIRIGILAHVARR